MTIDLIIVLCLLATCITLFIRNTPRMDVVAVLAMLALPLCGILTVEEAIAGFSDASVILIALLFVIGEGLVRTGVVYQLGNWLIRTAGAHETRLLILLMVVVVTLGSIMSSTGVVAIFIPVVLGIAQQLNIAPGRLMMPLAFAALISGMMTLVATPPNMVVNAELVRSGLEGFAFFDFTPIGVAVLIAGIGYMLIARHWLTPHISDTPTGTQRSMAELAQDYGLNERERRLRVTLGSPLSGKALNALALRQQFGINVIAIERRQRLRTLLIIAAPNTLIMDDDVLLVDIANLVIDYPSVYQQLGLELLALPSSYYNDHAHELGLAEVALLPESELPNHSIQELGFRSRYRLNVVGLRRNRQALQGVLVEEKLKTSDTLLVAGNWRDIHKLHNSSRDYIVLALPREADQDAPEAPKAPYALFSLLVMIALMVSGAVPNVIAALIGCLMMGMFGCLTMDNAYKSIHWPSLILIVGMLPFAMALQKTGGIQLASDALIDLAGSYGPQGLLVCLFALTAITGLFISNTATAILMAPLALSMAASLEVSPYPFAMTIAVAASAAFMTPISSPVNTLVLAPGGYRFSDFVKVGVPFTLIVMVIAIVMIPWIFPF